MNQRAVKYWYCLTYDPYLKCWCHTWTTNKDCLDCEALYVDSVLTEYPGQLWKLVEQYAATHPEEWVTIENSRKQVDLYQNQVWEF